MDAEVGFLLGDEFLASRCVTLAQDNGVRARIVVSSAEGYLKALRELESDGVDVIVAPLSVCHQLQGHAFVPVVALAPGILDILAALREAVSHGSRVGILHFGRSRVLPESLPRLLEVDIVDLMTGRSKREIELVLGKARSDGIQVIVTGGAAISVASRLGFQAIEVGLSKETLLEILEKALELGRATRRLSSRLRRLVELYPDRPRPRAPLENIVAESRPMREVKAYAARVAVDPECVLFVGEAGSGRSFLAAEIHVASDRSDEELTHFQCNAYPEGSLENSLEEAVKSAQRGTLFLAEVHTLPEPIQGRVAGVLTKAAGGEGPRVLASCLSEGDLETHLLTGFPHVVKVPPLRDRVEDIRGLFERFVREAAAGPTGISPLLDAGLLSEVGWERLSLYRWPGNARELKNLAIRYVSSAAVAPCKPLTVLEAELLEGLGEAEAHGSVTVTIGPLEDMIEQIFRAALLGSGGNRSEVARQLGISRTTLWKRLKKKEESV